MTRVITVLVLVFLTGLARSEPEVVRLAPTEGPFDNAFEDKCRSMGDVACKRIMSARTAPFEHVELHEAGGWSYVVIEHGGRWFVGPSISVNGVGDQTTSQRISVTFARLGAVVMPELGKVAVIQIGLHVTIATHCSHHAAGCEPSAPDYKPRVAGEYDDDAFVVCGVAAEGPPRCSPPIIVPEELVRRPPFTGAALTLSAACERFDWTAKHRSYDHAVPSPCRYDIAAP